MPFIQFPNIPQFPGVPNLTRNPITTFVAKNPLLAIGLGTVVNVLAQSYQQTAQWGIFDLDGNQLGVDEQSSSLLTAISSQLLGSSDTLLSTVGVEFSKENQTADFPVEGGTFATYNKVRRPATPVVILSLAGSESDRSNFLSAIDEACDSTDLYNVVTPEATYIGYSIERYNYQRKATAGAKLLTVEVYLQEVRLVSASFAQVQTTPISSPQLASATPSVDSGKVQTFTPSTSTLKSLAGKFGF